MKAIKNTLIISAYVLLVALIFSGAYVIGRTTVSRDTEQPIPPAGGETAVETVSEGTVQAPEYEVKAENGRIVIYKCIGENKTVVASDTISERVFPKEDIEELRNGVSFDRLEGAQQMFENFVS